MFVVAIVLFIGGLLVMGNSFALPAAQGIVFVAGLLMVSFALALPIHFGGTRGSKKS